MSSPRGSKKAVDASSPTAPKEGSTRRTSSAKPTARTASAAASPITSSAVVAERSTSLSKTILDLASNTTNTMTTKTSTTSAFAPALLPQSPITTHIVGGGNHRPRTQPYLVETDFADSAYRPRTIVFLLTVCAVLTYVAYLMTGSTDSVYNTKVSLGAVSFAFIVFCAVYLPDELMVRPHPAVWRALIGVNLLYCSLVIFLMFQDIPTIRGYLAALDPKLKNNLPERSYADDCRLTTPQEPYKWFTTIFDEFLIAHSLGYFAKMLIIRDWRLVTMISVLFEVVELSLQHILPNFKECWWDHVVIDIMICNAGGMCLGLLFLKVMGIPRYQWVKLKDIRSVSGKLKRVASQLAPRQIDPYQWQMFSSPKRLAWVVFLVIYNLVQELNCFTMKSILQMPPNHFTTISRLMIWGFIAIGGCRGLYVYAIEEGPLKAKRVPMAAWTAFTTLFFECVWIWKMKSEGGYFREPMPGYVGVPLYTAFTLFGIWFIMHFCCTSLRAHFKFRVATNVVFYAIPCALMFLFLTTNVDIQWKQKEFTAFIDKYHPFGFGKYEAKSVPIRDPMETLPVKGDL